MNDSPPKRYMLIVSFGKENAPDRDEYGERVEQSIQSLERILRNIKGIDRHWFCFCSVKRDTVIYVLESRIGAEMLKDLIVSPGKNMVHRKDPDLPLPTLLGWEDGMIVVEVGKDAAADRHRVRDGHNLLELVEQL